MSRGGRLLLLLHHTVFDMLHLATHVLFERARLLLCAQLGRWFSTGPDLLNVCCELCGGGGGFSQYLGVFWALAAETARSPGQILTFDVCFGVSMCFR